MVHGLGVLLSGIAGPDAQLDTPVHPGDVVPLGVPGGPLLGRILGKLPLAREVVPIGWSSCTYT